MTAWYWLLWAGLTLVNAALFLGSLANLNATKRLIDEAQS